MTIAKLLKLHKWIGLLTAPLVLVAAVTTLALNHQDQLRAGLEAGLPAQGPFDQYVLAALDVPHRPGHLLLGTHAGLFRSPDGGRSWQPVAFPVAAKQVGALAADPQESGRLYALLRQEGLFVSADGGEHWQAEPLPAAGDGQRQYLALAGVAGGRLSIVTSEGIYRQGATGWQHVPRPAAVRHESSRRLVQLAYDLHDGQFWGRWGVPVTDGLALALIALVLSGAAVSLAKPILTRRRR